MTSHTSSAFKNYGTLIDVNIYYSICELFSLSVEYYSNFLDTFRPIVNLYVQKTIEEN